MEKLYYQVPYVKTFEGTVISCIKHKNGGYEVRLDETGFYPEGGGQPCDTGTLGSARVTGVYEEDGVVIHLTDQPLCEGERITGILDWLRRYNHMQLHSGEHLLSGLIHRHYGYNNVGFHMGSEETTIDFNGILTKDELAEIELEANRMIYENLPIQTSYPSQSELGSIDYRSKKELTGQVRIITIPGGDVCACCGTHVMTTGEIGIIKSVGMIHYKGGVRISILCGALAWEDYHKKQGWISSISNLLSTKPELAATAVERLKQDQAIKDMEIGRLNQQIFSLKTKAYPESNTRLLVCEEDLSPLQLRHFCTMLYQEKKGSVIIVISGEEGNYRYAAGSLEEDMRVLGRQWNQCLNGKGGGSRLLIQGTFLANKNDIMKSVTDVTYKESVHGLK